ncbi:MAG: glycosyltransferase family 39 protein [Chloroflexi bacterium]|nr:glycosyltransferase family 39 protein [Chloroflexota bacterium]
MKNRHSLILTITLLLLAFGLRVYHLNGQSLWSDEGLSLYRITQPLPKLLQNTITVDGIDTRDTTPPFYFLLLRGWYLLTGDTVFALRYGGVLLALLAVPLIYQLGRAIGGQQVGLTAALLLAVSPFHIWQSQVICLMAHFSRSQTAVGMACPLGCRHPLRHLHPLLRFLLPRLQPRHAHHLGCPSMGGHTAGHFIAPTLALAGTATYRPASSARRANWVG